MADKKSNKKTSGSKSTPGKKCRKCSLDCNVIMKKSSNTTDDKPMYTSATCPKK